MPSDHACNSAPSSIVLDGVGLDFPIYHGGSRSLKKNLLFRSSAGKIGRDANQRIMIEALSNVSFSLGAGDRLALIGSNGAGKTTLLRVLAGIFEPPIGRVLVSGRVSPMLDISLGIDLDLTGLENIKTRGLLLGLSPREIDERTEEVGQFTGLGDYLHVPVRAYSSGMTLRLMFAVATCFEPEIILMDEWILAGDANFLGKAEDRIATFLGKANILVLASHNLDLCRKWCTLGLWLDQGRVKMFGPVGNVIDAYKAVN